MDPQDIDKKRAIELGVRYVDIHWKSVVETEVEVSILSGGFSSRLYLVEDTSTSTSNPIRKFLVRLYGGKMLTEDDPLKPEGSQVKETVVFYAIGLAGLGPKLYGSFDGGRVEQFIPSHMLREADYEQRPETMLELARKLARFHALDMPISQERHQILDACEFYLEKRDFEQFRRLAHHTGLMDVSTFEDFDVRSEIQWLKKLEKLVSGRIVTISGDLNKNNILVRDEPDKFGERVMMIDYELAARDYRGRDIGQVFTTKLLEMNDGVFSVVSKYPDETWRRTFVTEYLKQTKSLNYFEWDEKLDSVDHVLMEGDFFMFHAIHMITGFFVNQKDDSPFYKMPPEMARTMLEFGSFMIDLYHERKTIFIESYGKLLNLSS
ncbi:choline/ethanolamine kinase-like isoform X2 [Bradysia coprophila]|uniref:choline/ethanolamine kinase-like isoform X2 n=1 Tax=Bradysia coprophila TaxID=38358 RepID=UPI00187D7268|nr:choline/ethanolamine kinase-like isoform X2 [Bradysia coprophila]